jgi:hypothetical protein
MPLPPLQPTLAQYIFLLRNRFTNSPSDSSALQLSDVGSSTKQKKRLAAETRAPAQSSFPIPPPPLGPPPDTPPAPLPNLQRKPRAVVNTVAARKDSLQLPEVVTPHTQHLLDAVYASDKIVVEPLREPLHMPSVSDFTVSSSQVPLTVKPSPGLKTSASSYQRFDALELADCFHVLHGTFMFSEPYFLYLADDNDRRIDVYIRPQELIVQIMASESLALPQGPHVLRGYLGSWLTACEFTLPASTTLSVKIPSGSKFSFPTPPLFQGAFVEVP